MLLSPQEREESTKAGDFVDTVAADNYDINFTPFLQYLKIFRGDSDKVFETQPEEYKNALKDAAAGLGMWK